MNILGLNKTTLLDYPEHMAATIFTGGCNFCCPFCHNRDLVFPSHIKPYDESEILDFLAKRKHILDAVCITGGEPTLQPDLISFIKKVKALGYLVKLDTNGFLPDVLHELLKQDLLDYVAMDIKNSPQSYAKTVGLSTLDLDPIHESISLLEHASIPFEFRTTLVKELHTKEDMYAICDWISPASLYFLQGFVDSGSTIQQGYHALDTATMQQFLQICQSKLPRTQLRGI